MQKVPSKYIYFLCVFALLGMPISHAQTAPRGPLVQVELLGEKAAARPGDTITVALRQRITPGWHTYWSNPGDSGEPTRIEWKLPSGADAGPISWPLPHAIPVGPLVNYGYSDEILLLSDITVPANASGPSFDIAADVKWLVCKEICVPEEAPVALSLPLLEGALTPRPSPSAKAIAAAREKLPENGPWTASIQTGKDRLLLKVDGAGDALKAAQNVHFFPLEWGRVNHAAPQTTSFKDGSFLIQLAQGDAASAPGKPLDGLLVAENDNGVRRGYQIQAAAAAGAPDILPSGPSNAAEPVSPTPDRAQPSLSLAVALAFAFLGGFILNLMPCVFPVLSLKALSLARAGDAQKRRVNGLVYLAGVLASFLAIGLAVLSLRAGGMAVGWGMQFQSPSFVLTMMALFLALGLNMSGVFTIGRRIAGAGDSLTRRPGVAGYFFTGVLATLVATPCTAPFMGAAVGYAFAQPAPYVIAVLLALGLGFALPILLLSLSPALGRWLPKPGPWMETFKQLMAFPLYATVGWLVWVLSVQQGSDGVLAASLALLGTAFAAWLYGRSSEPGGIRSGAAALVILGAVVLGAGLLPSAEASRPDVSAESETGGPKAERFTAARLAELLAENKPVFVNLTAAWCITCKVNERVALRSGKLADAFAARGIAYLVGDWTNRNVEITELLKEHGRVGVPLYLLYSGVRGAEPQILPQLLTESLVLDRIAALPSLPPQKAAQGDL